MVMLADIERARHTISGQVLRTPLLPAPPLSALTGAEVFVKYENLQVTNSFKERGACVKLAALSADERAPRRDRDVSRQSRPGGGLSRPPARRSGDDRYAGDDALREDQGDRSAMARPSSSTARRLLKRKPAPRPSHRAQTCLGPSLRRSAHHRGAGHDRARNARRRAGARRAGRSDRRRRTDCRQRRRGAGA